jgi:hypothetical protein
MSTPPSFIRPRSPRMQRIHDFLVREAGVPPHATHVTLTYGVDKPLHISAEFLGSAPAEPGESETTNPPDKS